MGQVKELLLSVKDMLERDEITVDEAETLYNDFGIAFPTNDGVSRMDVFVEEGEIK